MFRVIRRLRRNRRLLARKFLVDREPLKVPSARVKAHVVLQFILAQVLLKLLLLGNKLLGSVEGSIGIPRVSLLR